jgi:NADH dehydrogenase/NADH:ubiquinone oxidoreductase subunit G
MRIVTETTLVRQARENVLEFLLINHPLDCPICDQGGECDLQDQTMVFGSDRGRFYEKKRAVKDNIQLGIVVKTFMTRCIHCTRCVRFVQNIIQSNELGVIGRGNNLRITTFTKSLLTSYVSGNIADICPVGALTSKPYAFTARPWELTPHTTIDFFDAMGGNLRTDTRGLEIMRILPYTNSLINQEWATDKARLSFDGYTRQRLDRPLITSSSNTSQTILLRPNLLQSFHILIKITCVYRILFFVTKMLCKLNFNFKTYLSPIADFENILCVNLVQQFYGRFAGSTISEMYNNNTQHELFKSTAILSRCYFFLAHKLTKISSFKAVNFVSFNAASEAPLFLMLLRQSDQIGVTKFLQISVKQESVITKQKLLSMCLSAAAIYSKIDFFSNVYYLLGQASFSREDFNSLFNLFQQKKIETSLFAANVVIVNQLEIG